MLIDILNNFSKLCIKRFGKSVFATLIRNECNKIVSFKIRLDYFNEKYITPWKYSNDKISPCETITFTGFMSMQNIKCLCGPPELIKIVDMVGKYYQWFNVSSKPLKNDLVLELIEEDIKKPFCIDAIKCQILIRNKTLD